MKSICRAINLRTGEVLGDNVLIAGTFLQRLCGLLGRKRLRSGEGLYIPQCGSIHTFFMRFPIDVLFLNKEQAVTKLVESLEPFRVSVGPRKTEAVLELRSGTLESAVCKKGDTICIEHSSGDAALK